MYKHITLIALLLPFSGYAITKQERKQEILAEIAKMESEQNYLLELIKYNAWIVYIHGDSIKKHNREVIAKAKELQAELDQIELDLLQEKTCSRK